MKFFKFILYIVLIVIIAGSLYFATQDGKYDIKTTHEINAPRQVVYDIVNEYKTWEEWGPWKKEEPTMVFNYADVTSGKGASYSWQAEVSGKMSTTNVVTYKHIDQAMTIQTPGGERKPEVYWDFESTERLATKITWGIKGEHTLLDKVYFYFSGVDFEADMIDMHKKGLQGIDDAARAEISKYSIDIKGLTQYSGGFYLSRTTSAKAQLVPEIMTANYNGISEFMKDNDIVSSGMPFTIYNETYENGDVIMTNAIPVREKIVVSGTANVFSAYTPTVTAIKTVVKGNYTNLGEAWAKTMLYVEEKGYTLGEAKPFEVYVTDPKDHPNPANWITEIYVPIEDLE